MWHVPLLLVTVARGSWLWEHVFAVAVVPLHLLKNLMELGLDCCHWRLLCDSWDRCVLGCEEALQGCDNVGLTDCVPSTLMGLEPVMLLLLLRGLPPLLLCLLLGWLPFVS